MFRPLAAAVLAATTAWSSAAAQERVWRLDASSSALEITYLINGKQRSGVIDEFTGVATMDPNDLTSANVEMTIAMDSVDVGDPFGTAIVKTADWFGVADHPIAIYRLDSLSPLPDGSYRAMGELTMRGKAHPVASDLTIDFSEAGAGTITASTIGEAAFDRSLFGIGVGFTALFVEVGDRVAVKFSLTATPIEE